MLLYVLTKKEYYQKVKKKIIPVARLFYRADIIEKYTAGSRDEEFILAVPYCFYWNMSVKLFCGKSETAVLTEAVDFLCRLSFQANYSLFKLTFLQIGDKLIPLCDELIKAMLKRLKELDRMRPREILEIGTT
jgi:hypothetical protein